MRCKATAAGGAPQCDRPEAHSGQHWTVEDGRTFRWGPGDPPLRRGEVMLSELDLLRQLERYVRESMARPRSATGYTKHEARMPALERGIRSTLASLTIHRGST